MEKGKLKSYELKSVRGATATPTVMPGSPGVSPTGVVTPTPTPTQGLGGS